MSELKTDREAAKAWLNWARAGVRGFEKQPTISFEDAIHDTLKAHEYKAALEKSEPRVKEALSILGGVKILAKASPNETFIQEIDAVIKILKNKGTNP